MEVHPSSILITEPPAFNLLNTGGALKVKRDQGSEGGGHEQETNMGNLLVNSPYIDAPHLLDLDTLEPQSRLLTIALTNLQSIRSDYATAPYAEIFNWAAVLDILSQLVLATRHKWIKQDFYIVVFRSRIPPTTNYSQLCRLDETAHAEAIKSGGFLKYWFGEPDQLGRNLATCIWRTAQDARVGGAGKAHCRAAAVTKYMYTEWKIERLSLVVKDGAAAWDITDWV